MGWLLGTEEESASGPAEGFSEEQMKLLEELMRRYQPTAPQPARRNWLLPALALLAMLLAIFALTRTSRIQVPNYQPQLDQLSNDYNSLRNSIAELNHLPAKLEEIKKSDQLLEEYEFHASATAALDQAEIHFTAVPGTWQAGEQAYLSVREDGKEVAQGDCVWDGAAYTASVLLPPAEEYDYYFAVRYADGTQKQQVLYAQNSDHYAAHPAEGMRFEASASLAWQYSDGAWLLMNYSADLGMPLLAAQGGATWKKAELVVELDGKELLRSDILAAEEVVYIVEDGVTAVEPLTPIPEGTDDATWISKSGIELNYRVTDVTPGQRLEAWVEITLSTGAECRVLADSFVIPG